MKTGVLLLLASGGLLGGLERINLGLFAFDFNLHVGGEIADASLPFLFRGGIGAADLPDGAVDNPFTTFAILDYDLTGPLGKDAPLFPPESAFLAGQNRLTLHCKSSCLFMRNDYVNYSSNFKRKKSTGKIPPAQPFPLTDGGGIIYDIQLVRSRRISENLMKEWRVYAAYRLRHIGLARHPV
jgi:hypothetical protein